MTTTADELREEVRHHYAASARAVVRAAATEAATEAADVDERGEVHRGGCVGLARLRQPDRGRRAAGGRDGARPRLGRRHRRDPLHERVGETGLAFGLDMTDEMLALARANAAEAGVLLIFLKGVIEEVPLPAASVDVVISNCVVNLSTDKAAVLAEIARVLKPGRRIRDQRHRRRGPALAGGARRSGATTSAASPERSRKASTRAGLEAAGFRGDQRRVHARGRRRHAQRDREGGRKAADRTGRPLPVLAPARRLLLTRRARRRVSAPRLPSPPEERDRRDRRGEQGRRSRRRPAGAVTTSIAAPTSAAPRIVITQATTIEPATPHRTAGGRREAPAPMMPEIVCVVETGKP